jgi:hypothetical protein
MRTDTQPLKRPVNVVEVDQVPDCEPVGLKECFHDLVVDPWADGPHPTIQFSSSSCLTRRSLTLPVRGWTIGTRCCGKHAAVAFSNGPNLRYFLGKVTAFPVLEDPRVGGSIPSLGTAFTEES